MTDKTEAHGAPIFGLHFMIDGYNAPQEPLADKNTLMRILQELPKEMNMNAISEPMVVEVGPLNEKDPGGLSGFVMIAQSHISFHTFPHRGFVSIDIYTCKEELDTTELLKRFKDVFQFADQDTHLLQRGLRYPSENIY